MNLSKPKQVYILTLGCDKNRVDSEQIIASLIKNQFQITNNVHRADVIIVNSCGFLQSSIKESLHEFFTAHRLRERNANLKVVFTGCMVGRFGTDFLMNELPEADLILNQSNYAESGKRLTHLWPEEKYVNTASLNQQQVWQYSEATQIKSGYGFVKISEGCNRSCSFCVIPQIRGKQKSIEPEQIYQIIQSKSAAGMREANLVAQDTIRYGQDLFPQKNLLELLQKIVPISELQWIRLLYLYPDNIQPDLLHYIAQEKKIVPYIDMPLQHISKKILRDMGRSGSRDVFQKLIAQIREIIPQVAIRTSFIVGYPGETEQDFQELIQFLLETKINHVGFFVYSDEEGSRAWEQSPKIMPDIQEKRYKEIMELQKEISENILKQYIGQKVPVLIEEKVNDEFIGRSPWDAPEVDGQVFVQSTKPIKIGSIIDTEITGSLEYDLLAETI